MLRRPSPADRMAQAFEKNHDSFIQEQDHRFFPVILFLVNGFFPLLIYDGFCRRMSVLFPLYIRPRE